MSRNSGRFIAIAVVLVLAGVYTILRDRQGPDTGVPEAVAVAPAPDPASAPAPAPEPAVTPEAADLGLSIQIAGEANGTVVIDLLEDVAPGHAARIAALAKSGAYDGVVFHRVIDGFMAQTGDVTFGKSGGEGFDMRRAGMGGSDLPDLKAEFSDIPFERGVVGMARSQSPDSANSQFFIMFDAGPFLNGQYTVVGKVTEGMEVVDAIKRGDARANGAVLGEPDRMVAVTVTGE
ncbi:peptidylprolyl isomerase [Maliponia aquimaris]|uniref:Peptidyl-prolyl cis-trans isomerase n=1 Tax=Maliponia aquimaris TaxID=1673631 RepID=A0A238K427_9RHOB|nr:peptidylprolyl isomerase [Maliponia aquimaris]SMX36686.1 Peptidyl-prolyl cis-trans isomerase cyp18 [Maliponia aquimaris]